MAKKRTVTPRTPKPSLQVAAPETSVPDGQRKLLTRHSSMHWCAGMLGATMVYVAFWPHDSVDLQQGSARYLIGWLLLTSCLAIATLRPTRRRDYGVDLLAWSIPVWMTLSTLANRDIANLSLAANELGWWYAAAAVLSTTRRLAAFEPVAAAMLRLMVVCGFGVAVYAWHQWLVGIPQLIEQFRDDPEGVMRRAGFGGEAGSAMRIAFENRLLDGGPTGTFALANSMAILLLVCVIIGVGSLIGSRGRIEVQAHNTFWQRRRIIWLIGLAVIAPMLIASKSRASVLALLATTILIAIDLSGRRWLASIQEHVTADSQVAEKLTKRKRWIGSLLAVGLILGGGLAVAARNTEWIKQAPLSVEIRLNYWRASLEMIRQSPVFGIGPGQFKSVYESYRRIESNEQISDPHNLFFQTATAGGWPAMILLVALLIALLGIAMSKKPMTVPENEADNGEMLASRIGFGAAAGLLGIWLFGAAIGLLPDLDAGLLSTVAAIVFAWLVLQSDRGRSQIGDIPQRRWAAYAAIAATIGLMASGGMTVPGVSLWVWSLLAIASPATIQLARDGEAHVKKPLMVSEQPYHRDINDKISIAATSIAISCVVAWYVLGIRPIDAAQAAQNRFELAWSRGQAAPAIEALMSASVANRWNPTPWVQLASVNRTLAAVEPASRRSHLNSWEQAERQAVERSPRDPVLYRQLGDDRIIDYQTTGDRNSLLAAKRWYEQAVELSPSHQAYAAQLAAIYLALSDPRASDMAKRAETISFAGGYYERLLDFTYIFDVRPVGSAAMQTPARAPAKEILASVLTSDPSSESRNAE